MSPTLKGSRTEQNLMRAFAGESQARNRYTFASELAHTQHMNVLEVLFRYVAEQERAHADVYYKHLKELSGTNISIEASYPVNVSDNLIDLLKAAHHNEYEEFEQVYPNFASIAKEEGFTAIAHSFEKIAAIEKAHGDHFAYFAKALEQNTMFKEKETTTWICLNCGHIHTSEEAPGVCPVCTYPRGFFNRLCLSPFAK